MTAIGEEKRRRIKEDMLALLFRSSPSARFTAEVARELARDEEFCKKLLLELEREKIVVCVEKNAKGIAYLRRKRWRLSRDAYKAYKELQ